MNVLHSQKGELFMDFPDDYYDFDHDGKLSFFEQSCRDADILSGSQNSQNSTNSGSRKIKTEEEPLGSVPPQPSERPPVSAGKQLALSLVMILLIVGAFLIVLTCDLSAGWNSLILLGAAGISISILNTGNMTDS